MNSTTMDVRTEKHFAPHVAQGNEVQPGEFYDRIIGIAGLGADDTVVYLGGGNPSIETRLAALGVLYQTRPTHREHHWWHRTPSNTTDRAHTILWDANDSSWTNLSHTLADLRRRLRPEGRLVLWRSSPDRQEHQSCPEAIERLLVWAGFVSVIVGRLSGKTTDTVVATGILVNRSNFSSLRR